MPQPETTAAPRTATTAAPATEAQGARSTRSVATMGYADGAAALAPKAGDPAEAEKARQAAARKGFTDLLGSFLGGKLYEVVHDNVSADKFLEYGKQGITAAAEAIGDLPQPIAGSGIMDTKAEAEAVGKFGAALAKWAGGYAEEWLKGEDGAKFRQAASEWVEGHPGILIAAALAAAAAAVAANVDVPELKQKFKIGGGLSASAGIDMGKIRDFAVKGASAGLEYKKGDVQAAVSYKAKVGEDGKVSHEAGAEAKYKINDAHSIAANGKLAPDGSLSFGVGSLNTFGALSMDSSLGYRVPNQGDSSAFGAVKLRYGSDERNVTGNTSYDSSTGRFTLGLGAALETPSAEKGKEGSPPPPPIESLRLGLNFAADRASGSTLSGNADYQRNGFMGSGNGTYSFEAGRLTELGVKLGYRDPKEFQSVVLDWKRSYKDKVPEDRFGLLLETTVSDFMVRGQAQAVMAGGQLAQAGATVDVAHRIDNRFSVIGGASYGMQTGTPYSGGTDLDRGLWLRAGVQIDKVPLVVSFRPEDRAVTVGISIPFGR